MRSLKDVCEATAASQGALNLWRRRQGAMALAAILVVALVLRVAATDFGLPYTYHPDEWALIMPALRILQTGDFNPHRFVYGSAYIYALSGVYVLYFLAGVGAGAFGSIHDIPVLENYVSTVRYPFPTVFLVGRLFNACIGTLTLWVVYALARRMWGRRHALVAALLMAVAPLHVMLSHFATTDVPMVLAVMVTLLAMLYALETGAQQDRLVAAFLCGLTVSVKYTAVPIVAPLVILFVQTATKEERVWLEAAWALLTLALGFLVGTPYSVLDVPTFLGGLAHDLRQYGPAGSKRLASCLALFLKSLFSRYNVWLTVPALLGLPFLWTLPHPHTSTPPHSHTPTLLRGSKSASWLMFSFPVLLAAQISLASVHYVRTALPLVPFGALLASVAVVDGSNWVARRLRWQGGAARLALGFLAVMTLAMGAVSMRYDYLLAQDDVRTRTLRWIEANLPRGSRVVVDRFSPYLPPGEWEVTQLFRVTDRPWDWYREQQVQFLVVSQVMRDSDNRTEEQERRYRELEAAFPLLATVEGPFLGDAGYRMWVYQVR